MYNKGTKEGAIIIFKGLKGLYNKGRWVDLVSDEELFPELQLVNLVYVVHGSVVELYLSGG